MHRKALAIDIGGTKTMVGLVEASGKLLSSRTFPTLTANVDAHTGHCLAEADGLLEETGVTAEDLTGIGLAVPGMADPRKGVLLHAPFSGWRDVPFREIVHAHFPQLRVELANDVNACAAAEMGFGGAKGLRHFVWVTVSTGIGAGIVVNGRILEGSALIAGELGHVAVEWEHGLRCGCGNLGCLEAHASGKAIERAYKRNGGDAAAQEAELSAEAIAQAARAGDRSAQDAFARAGMYLGRGLSAAVNLFNPEAIFVGGGVSRSFDLMAPAMRAVLQVSVVGESNRSVPVRVTELGYNAALLGAAALLLRGETV